MNQTLPKHITKILWMGVLLVALIAVFFCYSWIDIQPRIQKSNSISVLITTYINGQAAGISSYHFTSDDVVYRELSSLLSSTAYRRQMNQTAKSHDAANQNNLVCLAIQYDADEDVQLCMELWSDGIFLSTKTLLIYGFLRQPKRICLKRFLRRSFLKYKAGTAHCKDWMEDANDVGFDISFV